MHGFALGRYDALRDSVYCMNVIDCRYDVHFDSLDIRCVRRPRSIPNIDTILGIRYSVLGIDIFGRDRYIPNIDISGAPSVTEGGMVCRRAVIRSTDLPAWFRNDMVATPWPAPKRCGDITAVFYWSSCPGYGPAFAILDISRATGMQPQPILVNWGVTLIVYPLDRGSHILVAREKLDYSLPENVIAILIARVAKAGCGARFIRDDQWASQGLKCLWWT